MDKDIENLIRKNIQILEKLRKIIEESSFLFSKQNKNFERSYRKTKENIDDLSENFENLNEAQENYIRTIQRITSKISSSVSEFSFNLKKRLDKVDNTINFFTQNLGRNLSIFVGGALGGRLFEYFEESLRQYRSSFDIGETFAGSFIKFNIAASTAGLSLEQFSELLRNSSSVIKILGTENFVNLNLAMRKTLMEFGSFGLTLNEINEYSSEFLETQRLVGTIYQKSQESITKEFVELAKNASLLSRVTGKSARDILKSSNETLRNSVTFMNTIATLPDELRSRISLQFQQLSGGLSSVLGKDMGEKIIQSLDIGAASGSLIIGLKEVFGDRLAAILANVGGGEIINQLQILMEKLTTGNVEDVNKEILEIVSLFERNKNLIIQQANLLRLQGREVNELLAALASISRNAQTFRERIEEETRRQEDVMDEATKALMNMGQNLNMIFGNFVTIFNELFGPIMNFMLPKINDMLVYIEKITRDFAQSIRELPETGKTLLSVAVIVGGLFLGFKSLKAIVNALLFPFTALKSKIDNINRTPAGGGPGRGGFFSRVGGTLGAFSLTQSTFGKIPLAGFLPVLGKNLLKLLGPVGIGLSALGLLYDILSSKDEEGKSLFSKILEKISSFSSNALNAITNLGSSVISSFATTATDSYRILASNLQEFYNNFSAYSSEIKAKIGFFLDNSLSEIIKSSNYIYAFVSKSLNEDIPKIINAGIQFIRNTIPDFINKNIEEFSKIISSIELKQKIDKISEKINEFIQSISTITSNILNRIGLSGILNLGERVFNFIDRNLSSITSNINLSPIGSANAAIINNNVPINSIEPTIDNIYQPRRGETPINQRYVPSEVITRNPIGDEAGYQTGFGISYDINTNNQNRMNFIELQNRNIQEDNNRQLREQTEILRELKDYLSTISTNTRSNR
ncbi:MAG: hypothetical protein NZZ41_00680 [Candidatus Dojkabacteria bacterium]|nr:hypothetical protein [Candidatus Dojkabacteria bacterium]